MKKIKKSLKSVAFFLSGLILLQSCSAYKTPVTLQQAAQEEKAVKVITVDDDTYKYKYILYEDGQFYGVKDNPGEDVKFPIDIEEVEEILMKKGMPWWAWTLIIIGGIAVLWIVGYLIWGGVDTSGIGPEIIP
ncbi:MAG: hypothetical protein HKP04_05195 [Flavobacteriaceae bacterium]|nr:hypothetical protein [Flavobacteriaceae bacterium]